MATHSAEYFDGWYAQMVGSPAKDEIVQRHLGLPPHLLSTSVLGSDGITEVVAALGLSPGARLVDLACGRGGYGFEVAARTGAGLVGVDFSAEAIRQATDSATRLGVDAVFVVGDLSATGLESGSADGVMCIDAIHFAQDSAAAFAELRRITTPGGRVVLTCWEAIDGDDERLPERLRRVDLRRHLLDAGFVAVEVRDHPEWLSREQAMWEEAAGLEPGGDEALAAFHNEGKGLLPLLGLMRRVVASATAPQD